MRRAFRQGSGPFPRAAAALLAVVALLPLLPGSAAGPAPARAAETGTGVPAPDFTLETPAGDNVSLSRFRGKQAVLLAFWATWCPHCNEAVPRLSAIDAGPLSGKLKLLALDFMESREKVGAFVQKKGVGYTVLLDRRGKVARSYGVLGIPTYILVGKDGTVRFRDHELPGDLAKLLE